MKVFATPRLDAAILTSYFRARALARMSRAAKRDAVRDQARDVQVRDRIDQSDPAASTNASFWILHAR